MGLVMYCMQVVVLGSINEILSIKSQCSYKSGRLLTQENSITIVLSGYTFRAT